MKKLAALFLILALALSLSCVAYADALPAPEPDETNISNLVDNIIQKQMDDGQFLNVDLTMRDFTLIKKVLKKKLMSIYHVRIAYPER